MNWKSQCTHDLISWKILLKPCYLKWLMRYGTIRWWAELTDSRRFRPYLNPDLVVQLLTHSIGLYDLNRKWSCFCCFSNLFQNSLYAQCIYDISHLLWNHDGNTECEKIMWSKRLISLSKALGIAIIGPLAKAIAYKLSLVGIGISNKLTN